MASYVTRSAVLSPRAVDSPFLGEGYDSFINSLHGEALTNTSRAQEPGQTVQNIRLNLSYVSTLSEMRNKLSVSADASFSFLGAEADLKAKFAHEVEFNSHSVYIVGRVHVVNSSKFLTRLSLTDAAREALKREEGRRDFFKNYGDMFVQEIATGGELYCVLELVTSDADEQTEIAAELKAQGSGWGVSTESSMKLGKKASSVNKKLHVDVVGVTGVSELPTEQEPLLDLVRRFSTYADPGGLVAFKVTEYSAAELPDGATEPFTASQLRDGLAKLAHAYEETVTLLNDVNFMVLAPSQFVGGNSDLRGIKQRAQEIRDRVAKVGRKALENPIETGAESLAQAAENFRGELGKLSAELPQRIRRRPPLVLITRGQSEKSNFPVVRVGLEKEYKLVGGGAWVVTGGSWLQAVGDHFISGAFPELDGATQRWCWVARSKSQGTDAPANLWAYAIGFYDPDDRWDFKVFDKQGQAGVRSEAVVEVPSDYQLIGGGAKVDWEAGLGGLLTASYPLNAQTWRATSKAHGDSTQQWVTAYAIGIKPKNPGMPRLDIQIYYEDGDYGTFSWAQAKLPDGEKTEFTLVAGGADVRYQDNNGCPLVSLAPDDSETAWNASSHHHSKWPAKAMVVSYAIGMKIG